jgi:ankyrin repeat protein
MIPVIILLLTTGKSGQAQTQNVLINGDTSYFYVDKDFELLLASMEGDTSKLKAFIKAGADVNTKTWDGVTPLMYAAQSGHLRVAEILIDNGAEVNAKPQNQMDALLGACAAGHIHIADTLILNGANPNSINLNGVSPLMIAAAFGYDTLADMLLFYKANVNQADKDNNTPIHFSVFYNHDDLCRLLIDNKADIGAVDFAGFSPLMIAAQNGNVILMEMLINAGANVNVANFGNLTPLSLAIVNNRHEAANYLIKMGADATHNISRNLNQYDLACKHADKAMRYILIQAGARKNYKPFIDRLMFNMDLNGNGNDFMIGGSIAVTEFRYGLQIQAGYMTRPWVRSVLYESGPLTYYQFWEKRSCVRVGLIKAYNPYRISYDKQFGAYAGIYGVYTYGSFRGSSRKPNDGFIPSPTAGIFYNYNLLRLSLSYEYLKLEATKVSPHRISLSIGLILNVSGNKIKLKDEPEL